jgi:hypothetical protein
MQKAALGCARLCSLELLAHMFHPGFEERGVGAIIIRQDDFPRGFPYYHCQREGLLLNCAIKKQHAAAHAYISPLKPTGIKTQGVISRACLTIHNIFYGYRIRGCRQAACLGSCRSRYIAQMSLSNALTLAINTLHFSEANWNELMYAIDLDG